SADDADRRVPRPAWRRDLDRLAGSPTEQRRAERRGRRDGAGTADGADLHRHPLAVLVLDLDDRADADLLAARLGDDLRTVEPRTQRADPSLEQALLVLRRVVLEVLREVAELARLLDRGDD